MCILHYKENILSEFGQFLAVSFYTTVLTVYQFSFFCHFAGNIKFAKAEVFPVAFVS